MSDKRHRDEVVSTRFTADEVTRVRELAGDQPISSYIRETALAAATEQVGPLLVCRGEAWIVLAQAARWIWIRRAPGWRADGVGIKDPADARRLAAALLEAADVAEQRNPADEAWDVEHRTAS